MCLCLRGTKESGGEDGGACARDVSEIICSSWARTLARDHQRRRKQGEES